MTYTLVCFFVDNISIITYIFGKTQGTFAYDSISHLPIPFRVDSIVAHESWWYLYHCFVYHYSNRV